MSYSTVYSATICGCVCVVLPLILGDEIRECGPALIPMLIYISADRQTAFMENPDASERSPRKSSISRLKYAATE